MLEVGIREANKGVLSSFLSSRVSQKKLHGDKVAAGLNRYLRMRANHDSYGRNAHDNSKSGAARFAAYPAAPSINPDRLARRTDSTPTDVSIPSNIGFVRSWFLILLCIHEGGIPVVPDQKRRRVDRRGSLSHRARQIETSGHSGTGKIAFAVMRFALMLFYEKHTERFVRDVTRRRVHPT